MAKKPSKTSNFDQIATQGRKTKGVQNLSDFMPDPTHRRLDEMIDETIYIWKIEPMGSDQYGEGFKIHFKDMPNAVASYTAAIFGEYVKPQIEAVYVATNKSSRISLDSPVKATIRKAGRTYRFE